MKFELVDAVVIVLALFFIASYIALQNATFLYAVVLLVAAEIFVQLGFKKPGEVSQPESMP